MKRFINKYGSIMLFIVIMLICIAFFAQIAILTSHYSTSTTSQAMERAEYYTMKKGLYIESQVNDKCVRAEVIADTVSECSTMDEMHIAIEKYYTENLVADDDFIDIAYVKAGKVYSRSGDELTYSEMATVAGTHSDGSITKIFQYENRVMAFAVYAQVYDGVVDAVMPIYDRVAASLITAKEAVKVDTTADGSIDCFSLAAFSLLCKHDGIILDRDINDSSIEVGYGAVQTGLLFSLVTEGTKYDQAVELVNNGGSGAIVTRIGVEQYAVSIRSLGSKYGNMFLLDLYKLSDVYGDGYESVSQIIGTLIGLGLVTIMLGIMFIINRSKTNKLVYSIEMVNAELDCSTPRKFEEDSTELLKRFKNSKYAVVAATINNFRYTEEHFGDETTKALLMHMRNSVRYSILPQETFGYYGDGEFFMLLNYRDRRELENRIGSMYRSIEHFEFEGGGDFKITMSFSVYEIERDLNQPFKKMEDKVRILQSSGGMKSGAFSIEYYGDVVRDDYFKKAEIEGRMESALAGNEFHIFYQPKFNFKRGDLDGSEILVRWYDPKIEAYRKPAEFLPVFEEDGFIDKLDRFVFFRACENIAERVGKGMQVYPISVNVSRVTAIRSDFLSYYKKVKEKFGIRDGFVTLEFTESFAYENYEYLSKMVTDLHAAGFKCSLDDFGTGYSSYNILKTLDMDEIKLDKFFLEKGVDSSRDEMILSSVVNIVKKMGVKVTQEGVETKEDFDRLNAMGCDVIQGYYFSKPMKYVDYLEFIRKNFSKD